MTTATARRLTLAELSHKERNERFDRLQERMRSVWETMRRNWEAATLIVDLAEQVIKRDRHVGPPRRDRSRGAPTGACRKLAAVLHLTAVLISIFIDSERPRRKMPMAVDCK